MAISYFMGSSPVWFFVDDAGLIAVGATMGTFEANNHAMEKAVYANPDGTGPYTNPVDLGVVGISPIYFANDSAYYLEIYDADGNILHTVDNYSPDNGNGNSTTINDAVNYLVNPQFQFNYATQTGTDIGTPALLPIAQAGWSFSKNGTQAVDTISFPLFALGDSIPEGTPVQYLHAVCSNSGINETYRYVQFFMPNVRIFEQQQVIATLASRSSSNSDIAVIITQFFGTGGSPSADVDTLLGDGITLTGTWADYSAAGTLATVVGKTLGTNGDDGVFFRILMPLNTTYHIDLTNMGFRLGSVVFPFPVDSFNLDRDLTMGSQIPVPDNGVAGTDIGSVLAVKQYGLQWQPIIPAGVPLPFLGSKASIPNGFTYCDGARYDTLGNFTDGTACQRLFNVIGITQGNGRDYMFCTTPDTATVMATMNAAGGVVTASANGTSSPAFTYAIQTAAVSTNYNLGKIFYNTTAPTNIWVWTNVNKTVSIPNSAAAWAVTPYAEASAVADGLYQIILSGSVISLNSKYGFVDGATVNYYFWYNYNSTGVDPAPASHTGVEILLTLTDTLYDVMLKTVAAMRGCQLTYITIGAASTITAGNYFTASATGVNIAPWYSKDATGTAPVLADTTTVEVPILTGDTAAQVTSKTILAINSRFFQVPDGRGMAIMGLPDGSGIDPGVVNRFNLTNPLISGDAMGTSQFDDVRSHLHGIPQNLDNAAGSGEQVYGIGDPNEFHSNITGQPRNVPLNFAAYWMISH